jgi:predicted esterase
MKGICNRWILCVLFFSVAACSSSAREKRGSAGPGTELLPKFEPGKLYEKLACKSDPSVTYAIYFPTGYREGARLPLFLAFDPGGRGTFAIRKYKDLADKYSFILMGSWNSRNNLPVEEIDRIVYNLREEIVTRLPCDPDRLYMTGFSGGSRIASLVCMFQKGIRGMIGCSAGFASIQQAPEYAFDYFGIVGNWDFNLNEMILLDEKLETNGYRHFLLICKGGHDWPSDTIMEFGIRWHLKKDSDPSFTEDLAKLREAGMIFPASSFTKEIREKEMALQQEYRDLFLVRDLDWWKKTISKLRKTKGLSGEEVSMNKRLLSFLSLVCWAQSDRALTNRNTEAATYSITLYEMVDPENPEIRRMKAELAKMK